MMCDEVFFDVYLPYLMSKSAGKLISHYAKMLSLSIAFLFIIHFRRNECSLFISEFHHISFSCCNILRNKIHIVKECSIKFYISIANHHLRFSLQFVSSSENIQQKSFTPATRGEKNIIAIKSIKHSMYRSVQEVFKKDF